MQRSLNLSEKIYCLSVNPERGGILFRASSNLSMILSGGMFLEFARRNILSLTNNRLHLKEAGYSEDPVEEYYLAFLREARNDQRLFRWLDRFRVRGVRTRRIFRNQLVKKNMIRTEPRSFLFFHWQKVFLSDREAVRKIVGEIEEALLNPGFPDEQKSVLCIMAAKANLLHRIFPDRFIRKMARQKIRAFSKNPSSEIVSQAVQICRNIDRVRAAHAAHGA